MIPIPESEIQRLVRVYRTAIERLAKDFASVPGYEKGQVFSLVQTNLRRLEELDKTTRTWARRNIGRLYRAGQKDVSKLLGELGLDKADAARSRAFAVVNHQAVQALLNDPKVGIIPTFSRAIDEIKGRMRSIQTQVRVLRQHQKLIDETVARVGILEGRDIASVQEAIVKELTKGGPASSLVWRKRTRGFPPGHIMRDLADLPYVTYRTATGERQVRLERYAEMLARTKTAQALGLAQRNKLLENGRALVQVSNNMPLQDDACAIYMGKVYALTEQAAKVYGVPHVDRLPSGGCPFHPNCTHDETPYFLEYEDDAENRRAFFPTPTWALDKTWPQVQKEYEKRGGVKAVARDHNPQLFRAQISGGKRRHGTPAPDLGKPWDPKTPGPKPGPGLGPGPAPPGGGPGPGPGPIPRPKPKPGLPPVFPGKGKIMPEVPTAQAEVVAPPMRREPAWLKETKNAVQSGMKTPEDAKAVGKAINDHVEKVTARVQKIVDDLEARRGSLVDQIVKAHASGDSGAASRINKEILETSKKIYGTQALAASARRKLLLKALARVRDLDKSEILNHLTSISSKTKASAIPSIVKRLAKALPKSWIDRMNAAPKLSTNMLAKKGRAFYSSSSSTITVYYGRGTTPTYVHDVVVHEMGHRIEHALSEVSKAAQAYYKERTKGAALKPLGPGYSADEMFYDAGWTHPYLGKYYKDGSTELVSMTLEALLSKNRFGYANAVLKDKDLVDFVVGLLGGIP